MEHITFSILNVQALFLNIISDTLPFQMQLTKTDRSGIGSDLRRARERLGLSLADVASAAGVAASHVWNLENGNKDVSLERFACVCAALGLPVADVLADNLVVNRDFLFGRTVLAHKVSEKWSKEKLALAMILTDYVAGISTILCTTLLTGRFSSDEWTLPTTGIRDALQTVLFRFDVGENLNHRWEHLKSFSENPIDALTRLGLLTDRLISEFAQSAGGPNVKTGPYEYWRPVSKKRTERLYSSGTNALNEIDPQALGETFRKISEATADAGINAAIRKLRAKPKRQKG